MRTRCPHCQSINPFSPETSGLQVTCPKCEKSYFAEPLPEDETEGFRSCPFCHERIRAGAIKCRWCQSLLTEDHPRQPEATSSVTAAPSPESASAPSAPSAPATAPSSVTTPKLTELPEETVFELAPSWKRLVAPIALCLSILVVGYLFFHSSSLMMYAVLLLMTAAFVWFLNLFIELLTTKYLLTNRNLTVQTGLLRREEVNIRITDIRAVWLKQNLWERLLSYGDIQIGSAATANAEVTILDIDAPKEHLEVLKELIRE